MQHRLSNLVCSFSILTALLTVAPVSSSHSEEVIPILNYEAVPDFFQLPSGEHFVEVAGIAVDSKGHVYVFHRGKRPLVEFYASGKFIRSIADDPFVTAHMVRVDAEDNIWTTDVGAHVVLKVSPEGRVLLSLGRMRIPGDDVLTSISLPMLPLIAKEISTSRTVKTIREC